MLAVLTTGAGGNNGNMSFDGHNGDNIMGVFYAGVPSSFPTGGLITITHQLNIVGSLSASALTMANVPNFYQVSASNVPMLNFGSTSPWKVGMVPGFWKICKPGATEISPATATGLCGYN